MTKYAPGTVIKPCRGCGGDMAADALFCPACGHRDGQAAHAPPTPSSRGTVPPPETASSTETAAFAGTMIGETRTRGGWNTPLGFVKVWHAVFFVALVVPAALSWVLTADSRKAERDSIERAEARETAHRVRAERASAAKPSRRPRYWWQGGTLHRATCEQWRKASKANRVATAGDWLAANSWKGHLNRPSDFDRLKVKAELLAASVDDVIAGTAKEVHGMKAGEIAAALMVLTKDFDP